jgi:hypothetical protein
MRNAFMRICVGENEKERKDGREKRGSDGMEWNERKEKKTERAVNLTFDRVRRSVYSFW